MLWTPRLPQSPISPKTTFFYLLASALLRKLNNPSYRHFHDKIPRSIDERIILKFSKVVEQLSKSSSSSFSSYLEAGARPWHPHPFDYNNLMKAFARAERPDEVLRLLDEMRQSNFQLDVPCYTTAIDTLVVSGRFDEALTLFKDMISSGLIPDAASYTVLVKMYSWYLQQFDSAYEVLQWMTKSGCSPDAVTYSTLITGLCWAGRVEEALGVLDLMLEEQCRPNVHTYTPIVKAYCSCGRIAEAKRLVGTMERIGCSPNTVTYNVLIDALCKIASFDEVDKLLEESGVKGWQPDVITYTSYMDGLCKSGRTDQAFEKIQVMLVKGLQPTSVTLNILLDCLCDGFRAWEAKSLLQQSYQLGWEVTTANYNTVMGRLSKSGQWEAVLKLLGDMIKKGIDPNGWTFNIVIRCLCRAGKLQDAKCLLSSNGYLANDVAYSSLIQYFFRAGNVNEVQLLFHEMLLREIAPDMATYGIVIDCLSGEGKFLEALDCFERSLEDCFSPEVAGHLIYALIRGGMIRETVNLLKGMLGKGFVLDVCIYNILIKALCGMGYCQSIQMHKVCLILDKMLGLR